MTYLKPCGRCRFDGHCDRQDNIRESLRATNALLRAFKSELPASRLTSVLFTCKKRWEGFTAGRRVVVEFVGEFTPYGDPEYREEIGGWIAAVNYGAPPGKLRIWLDRETEQGHRLISLWPYHTPTVCIYSRDEHRDPKEIQWEIEATAAAREGRVRDARPPDSWYEKKYGLEPGSLSRW